MGGKYISLGQVEELKNIPLGCREHMWMSVTYKQNYNVDYDIEHSCLIQIIYTQLYGFKYSYPTPIICKQVYGFK